MSKAQWIEANLTEGELYAGILLGKEGAADQHIILLPGAAEKLTWNKAMDWAKEAGGELPTRREQSLLYTNLSDQFDAEWYWSGEQHAAGSDFAWSQGFDNGYQDVDYKSFQLRARAVRRLAIQSFINS